MELWLKQNESHKSLSYIWQRAGLNSLVPVAPLILFKAVHWTLLTKISSAVLTNIILQKPKMYQNTSHQIPTQILIHFK